MILVTGANGYLGGWVCAHFTSRMLPFVGLNSHGQFWAGCPRTSAPPKGVVHLAWYSSAGSGEPDIQTHCLEDTKKLVDAMKPMKNQFIIFASTASVYSFGIGERNDTGSVHKLQQELGDGYNWREVDQTNPLCAYTSAKMSAEHYIRRFLPDRYVILRFGSLMGLGVTRTKTQLCVNSMAKDGWLKKRIEVWSPKAWKPVIHVKDAAQIIQDICSSPERWLGRTVNVANHQKLQAVEIARIVAQRTGAEIVEIPKRGGYRSCNVDTSKLQSLLPKTEFKTVEETVPEFEGFVERSSNLNDPQRWRV